MSNPEKTSHPCQYCQKQCYGSQCKDCHLKMVKSREGICIDCERVFPSMRRNGTFRKRCFTCQNDYNKKYISKCKSCFVDFHAYLDDGRVFDKCLDCYKKGFKKCQNCDNNTREEYNLCKTCYKNERENDDIYTPRVLEM